MSTTRSDLTALAAVIGLIGLSVFAGWKAHKASVKPKPTLQEVINVSSNKIDQSGRATTNIQFANHGSSQSYAILRIGPRPELYPIYSTKPTDPAVELLGVFTNYTYDSKVQVVLRIASQGKTNDVTIWTQWRDEVEKMLGK